MAKILIADDSATDIRFIMSVLDVTRHSLSIARDGEEADKMIRGEPFDLVILDVVMPKKNGFELCREMKKDEKLKKIPIIILSSKGQESDKLWGLKQGADEYLTKPCIPKDLLLAVHRCLKNE
ncbi:MAG: response regulator [Dissulfurispiraceae bacterium]